jgi:hypothetical protein
MMADALADFPATRSTSSETSRDRRLTIGAGAPLRRCVVGGVTPLARSQTATHRSRCCRANRGAPCAGKPRALPAGRRTWAYLV